MKIHVLDGPQATASSGSVLLIGCAQLHRPESILTSACARSVLLADGAASWSWEYSGSDGMQLMGAGFDGPGRLAGLGLRG